MAAGTVGPREPVSCRFLIHWLCARRLVELQGHFVSIIVTIAARTVAYGQGQRSSPIASSSAEER